jgi:hypothetical protein
MTSTTTDTLQHRKGCTSERIEYTDHPGGLRATHCLSCGEHQVHTADGELLEPPTVTGGLASVVQGSAFTASMRPMGAGDAPRGAPSWPRHPGGA